MPVHGMFTTVKISGFSVLPLRVPPACSLLTVGVEAVRIRPARRSRQPRRPVSRMHRIRRQVAMVALTALALMLTTQQAVADGRELGQVSLSMPSLSSVMAWFQDPHWGKIPHQKSGTAAGHAHHVSAKTTDAKRGVGRAPGKGRASSPPTSRTSPPFRRARAAAAAPTTPRPASATRASPRAPTPSTTTPTAAPPAKYPRRPSTTRWGRGDGRRSMWT